jgi:hypothetical protein
LLGGDEVWSSLDAFFDGAVFARLAKIDQLHLPIGAGHDVARLEVAVDEAKMMKRSKSRGDLHEDVKQLWNWEQRLLIERRAIDQFQNKPRIGDATEKLFVDFQVDAFAKHRMPERPAHFELGLELLDKPHVFVSFSNDVLQCVELPALRVAYDVQSAPGPFTQAADNIVAE